MPVYCYYGDESYLLNREVRALRDNVVNPQMAALSHKVLKAPAIHQAIEAVSAVSFSLGGDTLVEIRDFPFLEKAAGEDAEKLQLEQLKDALEAVEPTKHVLFVNTKIDRKVKFPKWLAGQKRFAVREFKTFNFWETDKAAQMLVDLAREQGVKVESAAAMQLVETMGVALQPLMNEIGKLAIYAGDRPITAADVSRLSNHNENTFAMLADWINNRNRSQVFETLDELLLRQHPVALYGLTQTYLNNIFRLRFLRQLGYSESEIAGRLKKHPFKVKKDLEEFRQVPFTRLVGLRRKALELEWKCKTGQLGDRLSYEILMGS